MKNHNKYVYEIFRFNCKYCNAWNMCTARVHIIPQQHGVPPEIMCTARVHIITMQHGVPPEIMCTARVHIIPQQHGVPPEIMCTARVHSITMQHRVPPVIILTLHDFFVFMIYKTKKNIHRPYFRAKYCNITLKL